ncbi:MAG: P-loop NTPase, partial [Pirellulaceae bacterium]|nr:P-loop NTPase [Pirellulaceae bacterium]
MSAGQVDQAAVEAALEDFADPETGRNALHMEQIQDIKIDGDHLSLALALTTWAAPIWQDAVTDLQECLQARLPQLSEVVVNRTVLDRAPNPIGEINLMAKSVIAIASGKGGVGKSTMAASIALGLKRAGASVGLMDADVYGPSIPHLLGVNQHPEVVDNRIKPVEADGMPV